MKCKIYDSQCNEWFSDGTIFETKAEAIDQLIEYFSTDHDDNELESVRADLIHSNEYAELNIIPLTEVGEYE